MGLGPGARLRRNSAFTHNAKDDECRSHEIQEVIKLQQTQVFTQEYSPNQEFKQVCMVKQARVEIPKGFRIRSLIPRLENEDGMSTATTIQGKVEIDTLSANSDLDLDFDDDAGSLDDLMDHEETSSEADESGYSPAVEECIASLAKAKDVMTEAFPIRDADALTSGVPNMKSYEDRLATLGDNRQLWDDWRLQAIEAQYTDEEIEDTLRMCDAWTSEKPNVTWEGLLNHIRDKPYSLVKTSMALALAAADENINEFIKLKISEPPLMVLPSFAYCGFPRPVTELLRDEAGRVIPDVCQYGVDVEHLPNLWILLDKSQEQIQTDWERLCAKEMPLTEILEDQACYIRYFFHRFETVEDYFPLVDAHDWVKKSDMTMAGDFFGSLWASLERARKRQKDDNNNSLTKQALDVVEKGSCIHMQGCDDWIRELKLPDHTNAERAKMFETWIPTWTSRNPNDDRMLLEEDEVKWMLVNICNFYTKMEVPMETFLHQSQTKSLHTIVNDYVEARYSIEAHDPFGQGHDDLTLKLPFWGSPSTDDITRLNQYDNCAFKNRVPQWEFIPGLLKALTLADRLRFQRSLPTSEEDKNTTDRWSALREEQGFRTIQRWQLQAFQYALAEDTFAKHYLQEGRL